ncbi:MAG: hypothetical protein KJ734_04365, partial [Chloroflexi bacterium]|nr:hypothetical protein [Chloroflexota bacterium]
AVAAAAQLGAQLGLAEAAIRRGLVGVYWPARLEVLGRRPWVVADGAHNGDSASKLAAALVDVFRPRRIILVLGLSQGHNLDDILDALLPVVSSVARHDPPDVVVTQARHPRAVDRATVQAGVAARGIPALATETVSQALELAGSLADSADLVCVTGSMFVAAEARAVYGAPGSEWRDPVPY